MKEKQKFRVGDLCLIPWGEIKIPCAVVYHMLKKNKLAFMRRFAGIANDFVWQDIDYDNTEKVELISHTDSFDEIIKWIFSPPLPSFSPTISDNS